jgi:hypothetical protein
MTMATWTRSTARPACWRGELAGAVGLPEEAEADEAHSLTISFE